MIGDAADIAERHYLWRQYGAAVWDQICQEIRPLTEEEQRLEAELRQALHAPGPIDIARCMALRLELHDARVKNSAWYQKNLAAITEFWPLSLPASSQPEP